MYFLIICHLSTHCPINSYTNSQSSFWCIENQRKDENIRRNLIDGKKLKWVSFNRAEVEKRKRFVFELNLLANNQRSTNCMKIYFPLLALSSPSSPIFLKSWNKSLRFLSSQHPHGKEGEKGKLLCAAQRVKTLQTSSIFTTIITVKEILFN